MEALKDFSGNVIEKQLEAVLEKEEETAQEIDQMRQLLSELQLLTDLGQKPLKCMVDIGASFQCQATVEDTSRVLVHVGFGFYAEMTLTEAVDCTECRQRMLQDRLEGLREQACKLRAALQLTMELILRSAVREKAAQ